MATTVELTAPALPSDATPANLDVCRGLPPFRAIQSSTCHRIRSYNGSTHLGPYSFRVSPDPTRYLQPALWRLQGRMRILKADGTAVTGVGNTEPEKGFCLAEGWGHSWIKGISLQVCNQVVAETGVSALYYKSLVSKILNYGHDATQCHLQVEGYGEANDEEIAQKEVTEGGNKVKKDITDKHSPVYYDCRKKIAERFSDSKWVTFSIALPVDELLTSRDWIPGISAELHIARQEDAFVVTSGDANAKYTYALEDLILVTRKIQPSDDLLRKNDAKLSRGPAIYPFVRWTINQVHIPKDVDVFQTPNLFANHIPGRVIYFLVTQKQLMGSFDALPNVLEHHNLVKFSQKLNGVDSPEPLHFQWKAPYCNEYAFRTICDSMNLPGLDRGSGLTMERWARDRFIIGLCNNYDGLCVDDFREKQLTGECYLELVFSTKTKEHLVLLAMGIDESFYTLSKTGEMVVDQSSY